VSEEPPTGSDSIDHSSDPAHPGATPPSLAVTACLILWLVVQLGAIWLASARVPLWARLPQAAELWAIHYLVVAQVAASALTFPWLMKSWASTVAVIATAWPFVFLAGLLSPLPVQTVVLVAVYLSIWLLALRILRSPLSSTRQQFTRVAAAALWAFGGPILIFLHLEYAPDPQMLMGPKRAALGPMMGALWLLEGKTRIAFVIAAIAAVASITAAAICRLRNGRRPALKGPAAI
jgi:hypothetical protein